MGFFYSLYSVIHASEPLGFLAMFLPCHAHSMFSAWLTLWLHVSRGFTCLFVCVHFSSSSEIILMMVLSLAYSNFFIFHILLCLHQCLFNTSLWSHETEDTFMLLLQTYTFSHCSMMVSIIYKLYIKVIPEFLCKSIKPAESLHVAIFWECHSTRNL